ncbi:pyrophosphatase (plasmid) [Rhizobium sp. T1470]|uniref:pyrophosphatase n=1 Tax=unclassified Rhizobium TaxID=2613769 RepID=UPI001AAF8340|nr:pyrophosphatase [Rhizobium sp. T1473]MCA0807284.1 pyrophosphatase [Rhizobium sp. T1473]
MKTNFALLARDLESVSFGYAERFGIERDRDWYVLKLQEEAGEAVAAWLRMTGRSRHKADLVEAKEHFAAELADVIAHTLLIAHHEGVDLDRALASKWLTYLTVAATTDSIENATPPSS